jgi:hypothetical protein
MAEIPLGFSKWLCLRREATPEISQTRSVWFRRQKILRPERPPDSCVPSGRFIFDHSPGTACRANFLPSLRDKNSAPSQFHVAKIGFDAKFWLSSNQQAFNRMKIKPCPLFRAVSHVVAVWLLMAHVAQGQSTNNLSYSIANGAVTITAYTGVSNTVVIPAVIAGYPVTRINAYVFSSINFLAGVTIPDSVSYIGDYEFQNDSILTNVVMPHTATYLGIHAFEGCQYLPTITLPAGLTNIPDNCFYNCIYGLASINIPNSVTRIGTNAFVYCQKLKTVTLPPGLTTLCPWCFQSCVNLVIPSIPATVTSIGNTAFFGDTSFTNIFFAGNAPTPTNDTSVFQNVPGATIYYLPGTTGWGTNFDGVKTVLWNSQPQTTGAAFGVHSNKFGFNITGPANSRVVVLAATNLLNPVWIPQSTNTLTNGSSSFTDGQISNYPVRLYRVSSP